MKKSFENRLKATAVTAPDKEDLKALKRIAKNQDDIVTPLKKLDELRDYDKQLNRTCKGR